MVIVIGIEPFSYDEGSNYLQMLLQIARADMAKDIYFCPDKKQVRVFHDIAPERCVSLDGLAEELSPNIRELLSISQNIRPPPRPKNIPDGFFEEVPIPRRCFKKVKKALGKIYGIEKIEELNTEVTRKLNFGELPFEMSLSRERDNYLLRLNFN